MRKHKNCQFWENEDYEVIFCQGLATFKNKFDIGDFTPGICFNFVKSLGFFGTFTKKGKIRILEAQKQYFLRAIVKF